MRKHAKLVLFCAVVAVLCLAFVGCKKIDVSSHTNNNYSYEKHIYVAEPILSEAEK